MNSPSSLPDDNAQGFFKAGMDFWQSMWATPYFSGVVPAPVDATPAARLQRNYFQQQFGLWVRMLAGSLAADPVVDADRTDRRFQSGSWNGNPTYNLLKQGYLINARLIRDVVEATELDEATKHRLRFFAGQFADAMSPANFAATNPDVPALALETGGESLRKGFANFLADVAKGGLTITDENAFEIGKNIATSPGTVVFENELFQLIQYAPLTEKAGSRPLLIVPPCINKFYILDLQPENSFVRYAVEQGNTVLLVSWRNPDASLSHLTWDDYVEKGAFKAVAVAAELSRDGKINALGWCVGGTILACVLAVLRARGDNSVSSLTLLTTMLDFAEPGDLGVFIDENLVAMRENTIGHGGIYRGSELGFVFQMLRANDLIWPNVVNHYLKGKSAEAFDLLYWNADSTNLPGPMYAWYLRNTYLENNLKKPNRLTVCGTRVDLGKIDLPNYVLATREDHIVPWQSAYRSTQLVNGASQFVLGASGHIAGVINPVAKNKRSFWSDGKQGIDAEQWLATARETPGSWWTHWAKWLARYQGKPVPTPKQAGNKKYKAIEPAPGRYVKVKANTPGVAS